MGFDYKNATGVEEQVARPSKHLINRFKTPQKQWPKTPRTAGGAGAGLEKLMLLDDGEVRYAGILEQRLLMSMELLTFNHVLNNQSMK